MSIPNQLWSIQSNKRRDWRKKLPNGILSTAITIYSKFVGLGSGELKNELREKTISPLNGTTQMEAFEAAKAILG